MKTANFQAKMDILISKVFLWAIPQKVTPNALSYLRLALIPLLLFLLWRGFVIWGLVTFIVAALTDALDGAMARTRNQITTLGKVLDPIADKALIASMLAYFGFDYLIVKIFLVVITLEVIANLLSSVLSYKFGRPIGANVYGKIKMVLQSLSVVIFIGGLVSESAFAIIVAEYILFAALFFAILAGIEQAHRKWPKIKEAARTL